MRPHGSLDPYIFRRHRLRKRLMELWFQDAVTRRAAAVLFTTEEEMRLARPRIFGVPGVVVPLGLDIEEYDPAPLRGRFRSAHPSIGDRPIVLFLGRLNFKKGLDVLVRAFAAALRAVPEAHLVVAGPDGGLRAQTEAWIGAHGLRDRATLPGMVGGADKMALLADADLFVLPSYSENFGIAVIEAMACGLPVAVSDRVNLWREVAGAGAGWVVPPETEPVRDAIVEALSDPARAREMGARGRALVAERFAWVPDRPRDGGALCVHRRTGGGHARRRRPRSRPRSRPSPRGHDRLRRSVMASAPPPDPDRLHPRPGERRTAARPPAVRRRRTEPLA